MILCNQFNIPQNKKFKVGEIWEVVSTVDTNECHNESLIDWTSRVRQVFKIVKIKKGYAFCKVIQYINGKPEDFYMHPKLKGRKKPDLYFKVKLEMTKFVNWRLAPNLA